MMKSSQRLLATARGYVGQREADGGHYKFVDRYNTHRPLAVGYKVKYTDDWCDVFVSSIAIETGMVDLIGTECGVERHVNIFKNKEIWIEDGTVTPKSGDIIVYNWDTKVQPNAGFSDHIGFVDSVSNGTIITIEGNYNDSVRRRQLPVGSGNIRGFARPKYVANSIQKPNPTVPSNGTIYTVKSGDNLSAISKTVNVSVDNLVKWNNIANPNVISIGMKLRLSAPVNKGKTIHLPKHVDTWKVYKVGGGYTVGNEIGLLAPKRYGGLTYDVVRSLGNGVYEIKTGAFGNVAIYGGKDTSAVVR